MIFDKPNTLELLDAVKHFLDTKIKDEVPPHLAFKLRIVENVLSIVIREIETGNDLSQEVISGLKKLVESETANIEELAHLIRDRKIDLENPELKNLLVQLSKNKIAVDNPRYSTYKKLIEST